MNDALSREKKNYLEEPTPAVVRLWALRFIVKLGAWKVVFNKHHLNRDMLARLGVKGQFDRPLSRGDIRNIQEMLENELRKAEKRKKQAKIPKILAANSRRLAELIGLRPNDRRLLEFFVLLHTEETLEETFDSVSDWSTNRLSKALSKILNIPLAEVRKSLRSRGHLFSSGVLNMDSHPRMGILHKIDFISENFPEFMISEEEDPLNLFKEAILPSPLPELRRDDFRHVENLLSIAIPFLQKSLKTKSVGVNLLFYGEPGTGKTQLARVIAAELGCDLYEVSCEDFDGEPLGLRRRLRALRLAQRIVAERNAIVLLDEAEDVLTGSVRLIGDISPHHQRKAWTNRSLETNPAPTIWISNSASNIDPAFVRRFDIVARIPSLPPDHMVELIKRDHGDILSADAAKQITDADRITPAIVTRATKVIRQIGSKKEGQETTEMAMSLIKETMEAQGHRFHPGKDNPSLPKVYDPCLLNTEIDPFSLVTGISKTNEARLCLYGPPGTGKTAFAKWLSIYMQIPIKIYRASDILSPWVGGTEYNIAKAFQFASQIGAILLLDEADSFLQDRRQARNSWEITSVNEMLAQMENFKGILIMCTNQIDSLDTATLRRFDMKIRFENMRPAQAWKLFRAYCEELGLEKPTDDLQSRFEHLETITPGDFAAAVRRCRLYPFKSGHDLLKALEDEVALRSCRVKRPLGFV